MTAKSSADKIKAISIMAMLTALAVAADLLLRVKVGGFLTYEPKDVIITIGAFIYNPVAGLIISLVVCLVEMVTVSDTGFIGLVMNFLSSAAFVGVASVIYHRKKTMRRAVTGLIAGALTMIAVMLLWNLFLTPVYMGVPREAVIKMIPTLLLPFNAVKAGLNAALVLFLYKSVVSALRKSKLVPARESNDGANKKKNTIIMVIVSAAAVLTMLLALLMLAGRL